MPIPRHEQIEFEYHNIYDNVSMLTADEMVKEINELIDESENKVVLKKGRYSIAVKIR
jgi:hypothetical protein